jgi:hypothetical protein
VHESAPGAAIAQADRRVKDQESVDEIGRREAWRPGENQAPLARDDVGDLVGGHRKESASEGTGADEEHRGEVGVVLAEKFLDEADAPGRRVDAKAGALAEPEACGGRIRPAAACRTRHLCCVFVHRALLRTPVVPSQPSEAAGPHPG